MLRGLLVALILSVSLNAQTPVTTIPTTRLVFDLAASSLAEANAYRITAFTGANATKVIANPNDTTAVAFGTLTFTCVANGTLFTCTSTVTAGQLAGTTAFGSYTVALVSERRKADNTYAPKSVSSVCNFRFEDSAPSNMPINLRFI